MIHFKKFPKFLLISLIGFFGAVLFLVLIPQTQFVNSTSPLRDQLSSAQLSYFARLDNNNTAGNSLITINTDSGSAPSINNFNLFTGDTLAIANVGGSGSTQYIVSDIAGTNSISLTTGIGASNAVAGAYVVATRSAIHTVSFLPTSFWSQGKWQVLLKATTLSGENPSDGMPDQGGFDLNGLTANDVTCPWGATASVGTTVVLTTGISVGSTGAYHLITCALPSGTSPGVGETGVINVGSTAHSLINPSPSTNHTVGQANAQADTYSFLVRHTKSDDSLIEGETTIGKIALTESVQVTAIIDPTITFYIDAVGVTGVGSTFCGTTLSGGAPQTTAATVNFGSINLGQFNDLAQRFSCSTNAPNGYVVQIFESNALTSINSGSTIPDTICDSGTPCDITTQNEWYDNASKSISQFGYSLDAYGSAAPITFEYSEDDPYHFTAKPFGQGFTNAKPIMSRNSTPTTDDRAYICYRLTASNFQPAGTYQNQINFIATAAF